MFFMVTISGKSVPVYGLWVSALVVRDVVVVDDEVVQAGGVVDLLELPAHTQHYGLHHLRFRPLLNLLPANSTKINITYIYLNKRRLFQMYLQKN